MLIIARICSVSDEPIRSLKTADQVPGHRENHREGKNQSELKIFIFNIPNFFWDCAYRSESYGKEQIKNG
ncbi:MAG: hypothetical protein C6P37_14580 [Caldibacillus debilis]|uniref:Uncharacterized protein n=1 Tax=Caldibacillus debilis TaxID=301148 RepID=A0A3E0JYV4_9BACI|nr:MAG: hypothetical protein C6W56_16725 [Caldibacillus debilis]REJ25553.1 MAG: hypothetical protein C6P37_14580 [Caldibacillus debilis]